MERWLFLGRESRKKIEDFAYALENSFPDSWNFSRFVPFMTARQPVEIGYSLKDCFKLEGRLADQKLVVGQLFLRKPMIRTCFKNKDIWADFNVEDTPENYIKMDSLFLPIFGYKIENYPYQITQ